MRKSGTNHTAQRVSREALKRDAADVLKSARERAGLSAAHVAADLGQSETWVYTREDRDKLSAPAPLDVALHPALLRLDAALESQADEPVVGVVRELRAGGGR